ncbi:uncharacterized protein LOC130808805 [Amaranthus tricolor]|uniref:uncharacterized protein LOC130808805 n=1 Tax=Amaranthus tricolor TaxID=29722 RepID=UPI00258CBD5F|nr:uncharacterized protein LOC130808805 [Amaranthus tricolor]
MEAELQPPSSGSPITNSLAGAAAPQNAQPLQTDNLGPNLAPKRHRRPSVRLGDIGGQPATFRTSKPWKLNPHRETPNPHKPSSKTRPLTNLVTSINGNFDYSSAETTTTTTNNGHRKFPKDFKSKRSNNSKRARTNFRIDPEEEYDEDRENGGNINDNDNHGFHDVVAVDDDDNREEGFRDFDPEIDESGPDVQSPANSRDGIGLHPDMWPAHNRRSIRANTRFSNDLGMESDSRNQRIGLDDGIKKWLVELGLGRYSPVFEIHEVDEEVLPYLTLEDLKDMGINAVGSRRKLFSAIQKLRKGLS